MNNNYLKRRRGFFLSLSFKLDFLANNLDFSDEVSFTAGNGLEGGCLGIVWGGVAVVVEMFALSLIVGLISIFSSFLTDDDKSTDDDFVDDKSTDDDFGLEFWMEERCLNPFFTSSIHTSNPTRPYISFLFLFFIRSTWPRQFDRLIEVNWFSILPVISVMVLTVLVLSIDWIGDCSFHEGCTCRLVE